METKKNKEEFEHGPEPIALSPSPSETSSISMEESLAQYSFFMPKRFLGGPWSGHLPFANLLTKEMKPEIFVELGSHWGESYFTFCQTVLENNLQTRCYAIDTWEGDEHAGSYGEEVFSVVNTHNQEHYKNFSYLLRSLFDESLSSFAENSIDILHIDGLHTYEAVKHDFETWLPKVKPGGIILFHDVCARHDDFGVWQLWEEIIGQTEEHFLFSHSWGLGVWRKPGGASLDSPLLNSLLKGEGAASVRNHLLLASALLTEKNDVANLTRALEVSRDDLKHTKLESERLLADLKILLEDKKNLQEELERERSEKLQAEESYSQSTSWKVTKPLRALKGIFK